MEDTRNSWDGKLMGRHRDSIHGQPWARSATPLDLVSETIPNWNDYCALACKCCPVRDSKGPKRQLLREIDDLIGSLECQDGPSSSRLFLILISGFSTLTHSDDPS